MIPLIVRTLATKAGRLLPKAWGGVTSAKDGVEIFTSIRDWLSEASPIKKAAAATVGAAVIASPFAAPIIIDRVSTPTNHQHQYITPDQLSVAEDDGRVFHASYLVANRHILERIKHQCESGAESNMRRCEQAMYAYASIANEARKAQFQRAVTTKW